MTTPTEAEADANSRHKADLIAEYLWRADLDVADVAWLPYSNRHGPSRTRLARAAYRTVPDPCPKRGDHSPPSSLGSDSWRYVLDALTDLADRDRYGFPEPAPPRDLTDQRATWLRPAVETVEIPEPGELPPGGTACGPSAPTPEDVEVVRQFAETLAAAPPRRSRPLDLVAYDVAPALVTSGSPPAGHRPVHVGPPRGWDDLAALGPLDPPHPCRWCGREAIVGTLNGWRCAAHWPRRGDPRGDWGWSLNWAPDPGRVCLAAACYCGRCPHYDPSGAGLKQGARAGVSHAETSST
jgi:hypothetical protein